MQKLRKKLFFINRMALSYCADKYGIIILFVFFFVYLSVKKSIFKILEEAIKSYYFLIAIEMIMYYA